MKREPPIVTLRRRLHACEHTQQEIEAKTGIAQSTISRIMNGTVTNPGLDTVVRLNEFLDSAEKPQPVRRGRRRKPLEIEGVAGAG